MPLYARTIVSTGPPDQIAAATADHLGQLRDLQARGRLRAAGRFRDDDGFLEIFEAPDRLAAEAIARASPLVAAGLCSWTLREWIPVEL